MLMRSEGGEKSDGEGASGRSRSRARINMRDFCGSGSFSRCLDQNLGEHVQRSDVAATRFLVAG